MTEGERRQILLLKCDHPVAECRECRTAYRFAQLGSDVVRGCHVDHCPTCRGDLTREVQDHVRLCPNFRPRDNLT
jgi:hypothetical protein